MNQTSNTIAHLVASDHCNAIDWDELSLRDVRVAASVVQWLGFPCGQWFLRECGYMKKEEGDAN